MTGKTKSEFALRMTLCRTAFGVLGSLLLTGAAFSQPREEPFRDIAGAIEAQHFIEPRIAKIPTLRGRLRDAIGIERGLRRSGDVLRNL